MFKPFHFSRAASRRRLFQVVGLAGLLAWAARGTAKADTDYIYYSNWYAYDNLTGNWYDTGTIISDMDNWEASSAPDDPGELTGGDNWTAETVNGTNYQYDSVSNTWYVDNGYDDDLGSETWLPCDNPNPGSGGSSGTGLTVGSLQVDGDAQATGGVFVGNDFSIGGTVFNPAGLTAAHDGSGNFLGWQLACAGLQSGMDATFESLALTGGLNLAAITGNVAAAGGVELGIWNNGTANQGAVSVNGTGFSAMMPQTLWHWQQNGAASAVDQMTFDYGSRLNLVSEANSTQSTLTMDPANLALGTQINSDTPVNYSLLTVSLNPTQAVLTLADGLVLNSTARSLRLGNATLTGSDAAGGVVLTDTQSSSNITFNPANQSLAFSNGFSVTSTSSTARFGTSGTSLALGGNATATGNNAVAMAGGAATGNAAVAMGGNSSAAGSGAVAVGSGSAAAGDGSVALSGGSATASKAIAIGPGTQSQTWGTTVVGHYNVAISGNASGYSAADPALIVGTGANATAPATGLVIYNNGDAVASGNTTLTHPLYVSPTNATQPVELQVNGATQFNGTANLNGQVIIAAPQGGLPMGAFGN